MATVTHASLQNVTTHGSLQNVNVGAGSIHSTQMDLLLANYTSGMQLNGRMSAVRRFFCLFVTFDLCFTTLFWIICVLVDGSNIVEAMKEQILHYSIKSSVFDLVACSFCRFALLILFYSILHINHWWLVAVVTALSCAFLIAKTLIYEWTKDSSYPFEVMLVLISFLISWAEAWFIDFRVIPQEARAKSMLEVAGANIEDRSYDDRLPPQMERVRDYLSQYTESVRNFYSPLESPVESDEENDFPIPKKLTPEEEEYVQCGEDSLRQSWEILNSSGWSLEKTISHTDVVFSKKCSKGYKIYKLMAVLEVGPEVLFKECLHNYESIPDWNNAIVKAKLIHVVNNKVDITYQVAAESPGGVVSQRDFVGVRHWTKMHNCFIIAGMSVTHPDVPVFKNFVRAENGPNCVVFGCVDDQPERCSLQFLLNMDLKGWIPKYVIEQALLHAITDFLASAKVYAVTLRNRNRASAPQQPQEA